MKLENGSAGAEGLPVRVEPLEWAEEVSQRMTNVERTMDGALLLEVDPLSCQRCIARQFWLEENYPS
jgi:hypothetical protein